jgi:hypothetical protein
MTEAPKDQRRVVINEGTVKKNQNPAPVSSRPPPPKAQVAVQPKAPTSPPPKKSGV